MKRLHSGVLATTFGAFAAYVSLSDPMKSLLLQTRAELDADLIVAKLIDGVLFIANPQTVAPAAEWLITKPSVIQGAVIGGLIFLLIGRESWTRRISRAIASMLFAYMSSEGIMELLINWGAKDSAGNERLITMVLGIVGVILAEWLLRTTESVSSLVKPKDSTRKP